MGVGVGKGKMGGGGGGGVGGRGEESGGGCRREGRGEWGVGQEEKGEDRRGFSIGSLEAVLVVDRGHYPKIHYQRPDDITACTNFRQRQWPLTAHTSYHTEKKEQLECEEVQEETSCAGLHW